MYLESRRVVERDIEQRGVVVAVDPSLRIGLRSLDGSDAAERERRKGNKVSVGRASELYLPRASGRRLTKTTLRNRSM